jgi:hypothetical protein
MQTSRQGVNKKCVYLRYHLRQARTEAFVQTHEDTATPAPKTAIKWTWVMVMLGRDSNSQSSARPWFWMREVFWLARHLQCQIRTLKKTQWIFLLVKKLLFLSLRGNGKLFNLIISKRGRKILIFKLWSLLTFRGNKPPTHEMTFICWN